MDKQEVNHFGVTNVVNICIDTRISNSRNSGY